MNFFLLIIAVLSFRIYAKIDTPYEPLTAWDKSSIVVCWGKEEHLKETFALKEKNHIVPYQNWQKKVIQDIITKEFTLSEVGIEFIGWNDCGKNIENIDIVLLKIEPAPPTGTEEIYTESGGRATIGQKGELNSIYDATTSGIIDVYSKSNLPYRNYILLNTKTILPRIEKKEHLQIIALHEFGHAAGLRHQHTRINDSLNDPHCKSNPQIVLHEEPTFQSTLYAGPYDYNSIMNYCYLGMLSAKIGLTFRSRLPQDKMVLNDPSLYSTRLVGKNLARTEFTIRIGLSFQDKYALKCLYLLPVEAKQSVCSYSL